MSIYLRSLKGLPEIMQVMSTNYKQLFLLGAGWSGAVAGGVMIALAFALFALASAWFSLLLRFVLFLLFNRPTVFYRDRHLTLV
jgi:hypothetical protein